MDNVEGTGIGNKFTVIKNSDIYRADARVTAHLEIALNLIDEDREKRGKKRNTYLVINTDEPYADEVIEIMKQHGH